MPPQNNNNHHTNTRDREPSVTSSTMGSLPRERSVTNINHLRRQAAATARRNGTRNEEPRVTRGVANNRTSIFSSYRIKCYMWVLLMISIIIMYPHYRRLSGEKLPERMRLIVNPTPAERKALELDSMLNKWLGDKLVDAEYGVEYFSRTLFSKSSIKSFFGETLTAEDHEDDARNRWALWTLELRRSCTYFMRVKVAPALIASWGDLRIAVSLVMFVACILGIPTFVSFLILPQTRRYD